MVMPNGTEFQVNTYTSSNSFQVGNGVCHDGDGNFVVVWESGGLGFHGSCIPGCPDGDGTGIRAQRYASSGAPLGTEFQVNTFTSGFQSDPAVCCDTDGDFVVAWSGPYPGYPGYIFGGGRISAQRFASTGAFLGTEFQVNQFSTLLDSVNAALCCDADGDFVVVWNEGVFGSFEPAITGQRFASNGSPRGTEFQVASYTLGTLALEPGVCCDAAGDFVIAWTAGSDSQFDVFAQRYASSGSARGTEFQVNTYTSGIQGFALNDVLAFVENQPICCDAAGDFIVSWTSVPQDGDATGIFAQRFASGGQFRGSEFQVNTVTSGSQFAPGICCGAMGDFVIVWNDLFANENERISGQRFTSAGARSGGQFEVAAFSSEYVVAPSISCDPAGGFVVTWFANPLDGNDIFGQRFKLFSISETPALSWLGLTAGIVALLGTAARAFRRRR